VSLRETLNILGLAAGIVIAANGDVGASRQSSSPVPIASGAISIDAVPVPLNPQNPSETAIGDFLYAGGLVLTSRQTDQLHGLSDLEVTGTDRLTAVGDLRHTTHLRQRRTAGGPYRHPRHAAGGGRRQATVRKGRRRRGGTRAVAKRRLDALVSTTEWITHITRASLHLEGAGVIRGVTGDEVMKRMAIWTSAIPS
jgi:hypothetical protein